MRCGGETTAGSLARIPATACFGRKLRRAFISPPSLPPIGHIPVPLLTPRERATLRGLLSDRPPKAIAYDLGISDKTLYRHRANLMEKLGARNATELARIARERGLLADLG